MRASSIGSSTPSAEHSDLVRLTLSVPAAQAEWAVAEACALLKSGCAERVSDDGAEVDLEFWLPARSADPDGIAAALRARGLRVRATQAAQDDGWRDAMRRFHRPVTVAGTLMVRPPWTEPQEGLLDVVIDPGMAFGTAQHGTTRACLAMLCALPRGGAVLDAGCGTGVLAIAARRLGFDPVTAIDFDPLAVDATIANARANGVGLTVGRRTIGADRLPAADIVLANLTLTVLAVLADHLPDPGPRHMVLSGLRPDEADRAAALFAPHGLVELERVEDDGWTTVRLGRG
jgi:ribosomal protein L11 methyltransferase